MGIKESKKCTVNLSIDAELLDEARRINVDLSDALEQHLRALTRTAREQRWLLENAEAFEHYNRRVAEHGLLSDEAGLLTDHEPI